MEIGVLLIIYNYYSKLIEDFTEIGNVNVDLGNLKTSMNRFYKLIEYSKKNVSVNKEDNIDHIGKIVFANVLYGNRERPTLKDASFTIEPESITVISGKPIGSESGIFDLLLRLNIQHEGKVLIDDIDIREYSDNQYYDLISSARREPSFFYISIKENFEIINSDFEKIVEVCKKLEIHDDIINLEDGYDTILTDTKEGINTNLKNLFSIVRLLLKDSKVMLFDETITSFDKKTTNNIIDIIEDLKKDHTIIIIAIFLDLL
jgi:ATP-binding cassette subfamily B protein